MESKSACVVGSGDIAASDGIHLNQGTDISRISKVVSIGPSGEAGAGCRLNCDKLIIRFSSKLLSHEGGDKSAQIGTAAGTAYDDVRLDSVFINSCLGFKADDALM